MRVLQIVPAQFLAEWRRQAFQSGGKNHPITLKALAARILREGAVVYREDWVLEAAAVWEAVGQLADELEFFGSIAHYPGFAQEIQWLIRQLDVGELTWKALPDAAQPEVEQLYSAYHDLLKEYRVLDSPGQIRTAMQVLRQEGGSAFLQAFSQVELIGPQELTPLERQFLVQVVEGKKFIERTPAVREPAVSVTAALDPQTEVEELASAIRRQLEMGVKPSEIAAAFPEPREYEALLIPVFQKWGIPWNMPAESLSDLPLGRAIAALLQGEVEGWSKNHLLLLTTPGWGLPFALTGEERRALRLAPPLEGLPAWTEYLGPHPGWQKVFELLREFSQLVLAQSLKNHAQALRTFLANFPLDVWPVENFFQRAEFLKSWDALQFILDDLELVSGEGSLERFAQLFELLAENYQINPVRSFADRVTVLPINRLGAGGFTALHVGGMIQGAVPKAGRRHWLTRLKAADDAETVYKLITNSADQIFFYYPETDHEGKLNLPSSVLPAAERHVRRSGTSEDSRRYFFHNKGQPGILQDVAVIEKIRERILRDGLSTSQLNMYARCPYQFFCSFVLGLEPFEEESLELSALDEGNIVHKILQQFWTDHAQGPLPDISQGQLEIEKLVREHYEERSLPVPKRILQMMRRFIRKDLELTNMGWRPTYLEKRFSGLEIELPEGIVQLRGVIDRIDVGPNGSYVLYDYKTGSGPTLKDVRIGKEVQIATYLLAAQELFPQAENVGVAYYLTQDAKRVGIFRDDWTKQLLLRKGDNCLDADAFAQQIEFFRETIRGILERIFAGEFPPEPASSRICTYCAYQGISRREVGVG